MTDPFKIDLRTLTDVKRELIEAAMTQLAAALMLDTPSGDPHETMMAYRNAAALIRAFQVIQGRKPKPAKAKHAPARLDLRTKPTMVMPPSVAAGSSTVGKPLRPVTECTLEELEARRLQPGLQPAHRAWCAAMSADKPGQACDCASSRGIERT